MADRKTDEDRSEEDARASRGGARERERAPGRRRRMLLVGVGGLLVLGLVVWLVVIPYPRGLADEDPETTSLMEQRRDEARSRGDTLEIRWTWVPLDRISRNLQRAVIVAEDYRFREHEGIDWVSLAEEVEWSGDEDFSWLDPSDLAALARAAGYVWSNRSELRGRSTLTQQLAKNLYYGTDRSFLRKAMEAVVAKRLERTLTKDRILELYLNVAEWGPGIFGAEAAAQAYFGRSAANLDLDQAAALAATLPHPLTSNPAQNPRRMLWRKELVLDRIDPARRVPAEPMPLPDPTFDIDLPGLDSIPGGPVPDTVEPAAGIQGADTLSVDTAGVDAPAADTTPPDTIGGDAVRPDTTLPDTTLPDTTGPGTLMPDTTPRDTLPTDTIRPHVPVPDIGTTVGIHPPAPSTPPSGNASASHR